VRVLPAKGAELVLPDELRDFRPNVGICVVNKKGLVRF
jgi:hypothetical protein